MRIDKKRIARLAALLIALSILLTGALAEETVFFGSYEQDNNKSNGTEPIEWIVLDAAKGNLLLVSKYGLTARRFDSGSRYPTWANSDIRAWLNDTFFYDAFSWDERDAIINRCNSTAGYNGTSGGSDTWDHVFLLSREEARQYFRSDSARRINVTAYAKAQGAYRSKSQKLNGEGTGFYWLRSPGDNSQMACNVNTDGSVGGDDSGVGDKTAAIRPAIWVSLDALYDMGVMDIETGRSNGRGKGGNNKPKNGNRSNKEDIALVEPAPYEPAPYEPAPDEPSTNWFEDSYEEEGSGDLIAVADEDVNVRTGPGMDYPSVGVMRKGDYTFCYGDSAYDERGVEWYKIDFGGEYWVSSRLTHLVMG